MNSEAHLAVGWALAHWGGVPGRRFRAVVAAASLVPDIDCLAYAFGERAYATYHHAIGHNVFFFVLASAASVLLFRNNRLRVWIVVQLALLSHLLGDYFLTRFPLEFFWPVWNKGFIYGYKIGLDHPINNALSYLSLLFFVVMAVFYKRTPMELLSVELDQRIVNLFRHKPLTCHVCGRKANERCGTCGQPACMRHGRIGRGFGVTCQRCHGQGA